MTALAPIPPDIFKELIEKYGFRVEQESEYNWTLFKKDAPQPIIILPKKGDLVAVDVMMGILNQIRMDNKTYFKLLQKVQN